MSNATTRSLPNRMTIDLKKITTNYRSIVTTIDTSPQDLMADGINPANINFIRYRSISIAIVESPKTDNLLSFKPRISVRHFP